MKETKDRHIYTCMYVGVFLGSHDDVRFEPKHAVIFPRHFESQVNAPTNVIRFIVKAETSYSSVIQVFTYISTMRFKIFFQCYT